jgi:V/A-type H+-transporting ATPase subunit I
VILAMTRMDLAMVKDALPELLRVLHDKGVVHLDPPRELPPGLGSQLARVRLSAEDEERRGQLHAIAASATELLGEQALEPDPAELEDLERLDYAGFNARFQQLSGELRRLKQRADDLENENRVLPHYKQLIEAFLSIKYAFDRRPDWAMVGLVLDRAREPDIQILRDEISRATRGHMEFFTATLDPARLAAIVVYDRQFESDLERLIWGKGVEHLKLPGNYLGRPLEDVVADITGRLQELPKTIHAAHTAYREALDARRHALAAFRDAARHRRTELLAKSACLQSSHAVLLSGWVPREHMAALQSTLRERFGDTVLAKFRAPRSEELPSVPVVLNNPRVTRPFELLLSPLQTPRYGSLDPTLSLALFFPLFFGVMVGDIGHGLLIVLGAFGLRRWKPQLPKAVSTILLTMGASAIIFGFLFGEFFGDLARPWLRPLLFDRAERIVPLLILAFSIGIVHVLLGSLLGIIGAVRLHDSKRATERGAAMGILIAGLVLVGAAAQLLPDGWLTPSLVLMVAMVPVLLYAGGFLAILELISTASHILSYARLMALGLAGAMLAQVSSRLGSTTDSIVLGVLIVLPLHLLHLVMNLFSPTVQALRLQYVEFFSKFYEPGGVPYTPFRK